MLYTIHCKFHDHTAEPLYVDTLDELLRNIEATWSKIPHRVRQIGLLTEVLHVDDDFRLAVFTLTPVHARSLPGHF